jgi:hypothetical protein
MLKDVQTSLKFAIIRVIRGQTFLICPPAVHAKKQKAIAFQRSPCLTLEDRS